MSSKIKVDTIENVAGSGNVSLGSGHNLVVPGNITGQGTLSAKGGAVFNEDSADVDFRVESNGNANMLFVDGGNDGVGIGTSSVDTNATMTVSNTGDNHAISIVGALNKSRIHFQGANTGSAATDGLVIGLSSSDDTNDDSALIGLKESGSMSFQTNNTTRMQITSGGHTSISNNSSDGERTNNDNWSTIHSDRVGYVTLFVENSADSSPYGMFIDFSDSDPDNTSSYFLKCEGSSGAERCIIYSDGDVKNHDNSYGALSDERIKDNITDAKSQWDDIKALKVRNFQLKDDIRQYGADKAKSMIGVVAQEVESAGMNGLIKHSDPNKGNIVSDSAFGTVYKDGDDIPDGKAVGDVKEVKEKVKGVSYSVLYMKAIKALQEAMTRIETLEAEVKALKGE